MKQNLLTFLLFAALFAQKSTAQIAFSNRNDLLPATKAHSGVALAVLDMNGDGLDDILQMDKGRHLRIVYQTSPGQPFESRDFGEITDDAVWGIAVADADNNGIPDVLTGGDYDGIKILLAQPDGSGFDLTDLTVPETFVQSVNWFDINNDGWLDAFICHDDGMSRIFKNRGNGTFVFDDTMMPLATVPASDNSGNYGTVWSDVDNNGHADLYIAKCRQGVSDPTDPRRINQLFLNNGDGTYSQDIQDVTGLRIGAQSWTADFGDMDNDGDMDCFITNHDVSSQLLENDGAGHFTDITATAGLLDKIQGVPIQGIFRDFDNDGFMDILVGGGDEFASENFPYLFRNNGDKTFTNAPGLFNTNSMESFAVGDLNHDGFVDIYGGYAEIYTTPTNIEDVLWMNRGNDNHFFGLGLRGKISNHSGVGSRITLHTPGGGLQIREVRSGESYGIMNSMQVQFGLGQTTAIDSVTVLWPSGHRDVILSPAADQYLVLEEGGCLASQVRIEADGPTVFCTGDSVKMEAPAGFAKYEWSTGDTTAFIFAGAAGNYKVTVTTADGCTAISNGLPVRLDPVEVPQIALSGDSVLCDGSSVVLTASIGTAWLWSNGQTTKSITVSSANTYTVSAQGLCAQFASAPVSVSVLTPELPEPQGDVTWPNGSAILTASGDEPHWFSAASGGPELGIGSPFATPPLTQNTTFWVSNNDIEDQPNAFTGMLNHAGTNGSNQFNGQIIFDCHTPFILKTVKVVSTLTAIQVRQIDLTDAAGNILKSKTLPIPPGTTTLALDMEIPRGNDLVLTTNEAVNLANLNTVAPGLRRSDAGVSYPYEIPGFVTLKSSNAPGTSDSRYYYFYNWEVDFIGHACMSARVPVLATVDPNLVGTDAPGEESLLAILPNPTSGAVFVKTEGVFSGAAEISVKVLDARGLVLREQKSVFAQNGAVELQLGGLPKGAYWLQVTDGEHLAFGKVAVQ